MCDGPGFAPPELHDERKMRYLNTGPCCWLQKLNVALAEPKSMRRSPPKIWPSFADLSADRHVILDPALTEKVTL